MRILLIEPNIVGYALMPSMALAVLKSFVNNRTEHQAEIADFIFHKKDWREYLKNRIERFKPDIVGFSVMSSDYIQALKMTRFIKEKYNLPVLFGGVHVILMPEQTIKNKDVDFICTCEGEYVLKDLLDKNLDCKGIKGVWYKDDTGQIVKNVNRDLIQNLDALPFPDFKDYDMKKHFLLSNQNLPIMTSRGCPYNCTYCSNHAIKKQLNGRYIRSRSVDNVIKEIELRIKQYYSQGMRYLFFYDDIFILNKAFVFEFCRKFKEKGFHRLIKWNVNVRANLVTDEIIKVMKDAGCYEIRMGVEAGNDKIRNELYKRNMTKEQIFNAVNIIKKYKIHIRLNFLIGAPYETAGMIQETLDLAKKIDANHELFAVLIPLPATELKEICEKEGLIEKKGFKDSLDMYTTPILRTKYIPQEQMQHIIKKIQRYQIIKYLSRGLKMKGPIFLLDMFIFLAYYMPKYGLELDHAYRFTINRYILKDNHSLKSFK